MRGHTLALLLCVSLLGCTTPARDGAGSTMKQTSIAYPATERRAVQDTLHGTPVADPYRWLEDEKEPAVQKWMDAQDALTRGALAARPDRAAFARRLKELAYVATIGVPSKRGTRYFYGRRGAGQEKAVFCMREGVDGAERVLLDPNTMSADGTLSLGVLVPSEDGKKLAYAVRMKGEDKSTLHLMDIDTGKLSDVDTIEGARYATPVWTPDGAGFYYTALPTDPKIPVDALPGEQDVRYHKLGTPQKDDLLVYPKTGDPTRFLQPSLSRDGRWLFVYDLHGWSRNDVFVRDLADPQGTFKPLVKGVDAQFSVGAWRGTLYVQTNDGAPRGRVFTCDPARPDRAQWREIVPEDKDATLEGISILGEHIAGFYLHNATNAVRLFALDGRHVRDVALPGLGVVSGLSGREDEDEAFFQFSSFTFPPEIYRTSIATGATTRWAKLDIPVDPAPYEVEQVWYPSKDGTKVSMFVVHRRDMKRDGNTPLLLTGYGGFNVSLTPDFSAFRYAWLERGGAVAVPNLRGGGEYGEEWHRAGMRDRKQNVFDDFIAAAEWLIAQKITRPEKLAIYGGSNGGLLVGAAMVQRPDLYRAVVCAVPLLDMVRYHLFGSGRTWIDEYGSAEDAAQFRTLYAYSPYHHVKDKTRYPSLLMLSADHDDRVDPLHARKLTAALQAAQIASPAERPMLLRVERNAGHGGADLRRQVVEEYADMYAYLTWQLGM